ISQISAIFSIEIHRSRPDFWAIRLAVPGWAGEMAKLSTAAPRLEALAVTVNGRAYALPVRPTVVICLDGFDPAYLEHGFAAGSLPALRRLARHGFAGFADAAMPSTTNANNTSIVTGVAPAQHGINGNFYLDAETGEEVMVTDARRLRCGTIL